MWIAGLGDEGGSSWLALGDEAARAARRRRSSRSTSSSSTGSSGAASSTPTVPRQYAVRKSLFYYQPDQMPAGYYRSDLNWTTWTSWKKEATEIVDRSYNYPHVAALHWTMYRLARNHSGLVTNHPWDWYLDKAYRTSVAMVDARGALRAVRPDGGHGLPGDPARPAARGLDDAGGRSRGADEGAGGGLDEARLPVRQRDAVGLDRPGGGVRLDQVLRRHGQGAGDARRDRRLHADRAALGLQRQRPPLLGLPVRAARCGASSASCTTTAQA